MKLLFDQNISFRILRKVEKYFPESKQVSDLRVSNISDLGLWEFAKKNDFSIVTFDSDFFDISNLYGHPPKIIWLRTGNRRTEQIAELLIQRLEVITDFLSNSNYDEISCMEVRENQY